MSGPDESRFVSEERSQRLEKLAALRERGVEPYPVGFERADAVAEIAREHGGLADGEETEHRVRIAGRLLLIRRHGGVVFCQLRDGTGQIQLMASRKEIGEDSHEAFSGLDLGDWIGVDGSVMKTRRGELTIKVAEWQLLAKALRPLPKEGSVPSDPDVRFRERHLDLILNEGTRRIFEIRSAAITAARAELADRGFAEVETPVLDVSAGGAAARPFVTHHNALDLDMYMRIALELPLKRLVVGGMERVFEIGRVFRNEGLDRRHNPEFTMLEAYQALTDYNGMMELTEALISRAAREAIGTLEATAGDDGRIDLEPPWRRVTMAELVAEHAGAEMHPSMPLGEARKIADGLGVDYLDAWGPGRIMAEVFDDICEPKLIAPTFVLDHPREVSPLARAHRDDPELCERFELVIGGRELANAYSELNDPLDQRERFEASAALREAGDEEAETLNEEFIRAIEHGLPPTGGLGIGLDRLVMLLSGASSIREVILFPTMRPQAGRSGWGGVDDEGSDAEPEG